MKWELLDGLGDTEVQALLSIARRRKFARGEVVFHEDDPADTLHLVDKGRFAVRVATPLGDTAILVDPRPGRHVRRDVALGSDDADAARRWRRSEAARDPLGASHGLRGTARPASGDGPTWSSRCWPGRCGGSPRAPGRGALRARRPARAAAACWSWAALYADGDVTLVPLTQEDLAGLAGTSRATVNRVLRERGGAGHREARPGPDDGAGRRGPRPARALARCGVPAEVSSRPGRWGRYFRIVRFRRETPWLPAASRAEAVIRTGRRRLFLTLRCAELDSSTRTCERWPRRGGTASRRPSGPSSSATRSQRRTGARPSGTSRGASRGRCCSSREDTARDPHDRGDGVTRAQAGPGPAAAASRRPGSPGRR